MRLRIEMNIDNDDFQVDDVNILQYRIECALEEPVLRALMELEERKPRGFAIIDNDGNRVGTVQLAKD